MSEPTASPLSYKIETARVVERELVALERRAVAAGFGQSFRAALDQIFRILRIYPPSTASRGKNLRSRARSSTQRAASPSDACTLNTSWTSPTAR